MKNTYLRSPKLLAIFLILLILPVTFFIFTRRQVINQHAATQTTDYTPYVNMVQGPGTPNNSDRQIFMRYPLGRIGLWSRDTGEIADSVTRGVRIYPLVNQLVSKDNTDWRGTINANPAQTDITYTTSSPANGSTVSLSVTPNVSLYKYHFNNASSFGAVGITLGATHNQYDPNWSSTSITVIDNQTMQATLTSSARTIYFYIKFNVPGTGTASGNQGYMKFSPSTTDVTAAISLSHTSMNQAQQFFNSDFSDFNFAAAAQRLKDAWNAKLGKIDVQNADQLTKQMLYTGLYSVYANIVNATDGSPYASYAAAYGSPVLTVGSSIGWEYVGGGYFRSAFDQGRIIYYLLTLLDPAVMKDILHTYQAQYDRDGVLLGNWDPYTPSAWTDQQWGFWGGMFLRANLMGVTGVDYIKGKNAIASTFGNPNNIMAKSQYLAKGYIPADGGVNYYMSRALEWSTDIHGLAVLANVLGDSATYNQWIAKGQNYKNNWNASAGVFQGKNSNGSWGAANSGFFEGTDQTYAFDIPHDPLSLADLYGDSNMASKINSLIKPNMDYNDFIPGYRILPIYNDSPSTAEDISRNRWIPQFKSLNMWEGWWSGSDVFYTDNAGGIVLAALGLYPIQAPGAQWVITSPAITTAVIHGIKDITIQANNNSSANTYVSSIQVNGATYPSYFISGKTLVSQNTAITLGMNSTPSKIGSIYITGADGEILSAGTDNTNYLQFQNDPVAQTSRAKIYTTKAPVSVAVNNTPITGWTYAANIVDIKGIPAGNVLICFSSTCHPAVTSLPTPTIGSSPTIIPGANVFSVTVCPHGLGNCGDNAKPNSVGNTNPLNQTRNVTLTIFNANNQQLMQSQGTVSYTNTEKNFQGTVSVANLANGAYLASIKLSGFLPKQIPGIVTINSSTSTITLPQVTLVNGDINNDNQLDILDYNLIIACFGSKPCANKTASDINDDGNVDGIDYNLFLRELSVQK